MPPYLEKKWAWLAFALLGIFSGTNFIFMKWASVWISPMQIAFGRVLFGFIPLALFAWHRKAIHWGQLRYLHHFAAMGVVATAFYYFALTKGTALLPSGISAVLANAATLFTAIFSVLFLKSEKLSRTTASGVLLGFLGIILIARPWEDAGGTMDLWGVFWLLASASVLGVSYIYARVFLSGLALSPLTLATWQIGIATLVLAMFTDFDSITAILQSPLAMAGLVLGGGVLGTGACFLLYYFLLEEFGAVASSAALYLAPAVALLIGWMAGENFGLLEFLSIALTILGVLILQLGRKP